jgi:hypothetical protein
MAEDPTVVSCDIETPSQTEPSTTESETGGTEQPEPQT